MHARRPLPRLVVVEVMATKYPTPHLLGTVTYQDKNTYKPDGDTIHLRNPKLIDAAGVHNLVDGKLEVWMPGRKKPRILTVSKSHQALTIRLAGFDSPEEHYMSMPFESGGKKYGLNTAHQHENRCQPLWEPATDFMINTLEKDKWALIEIDPDVTDSHGRVLGYVYRSTSKGEKGTNLSVQSVRKGLSFPFVFETARDHIEDFLEAGAAARKAKRGVWKHYQDKPLPYSQTYEPPKHHTDDEPNAQQSKALNLPVVFRRVVDVHQLKGLSLKTALQKYDCIDYETGELVTGDKFRKIPIDNRIWAPHRYKP